MGALNSLWSPCCLPVFSWGRGGDSGPRCCWEQEHGGAAFPAPVLASPTKLPPHPDRNRSPHSALRAQSSQPPVPSSPAGSAQLCAPSPAASPLPRHLSGAALAWCRLRAPKVAAPGREHRDLEPRGLPPLVLAALEDESPSSELSTQQPPVSASALLTTSNSTHSVPGEQGRQQDGAFPHVPGQQSSRSPSFPILSRGVTFISTSSGVLTVLVSEQWANPSAWVGCKEPKAGGKVPAQPS